MSAAMSRYEPLPGRFIRRKPVKRARSAGPVYGPAPGPSMAVAQARKWSTRALNTHRFTRYALSTSVVDLTTAFSSNNHIFNLAAVVNAVEFRELFDQFMIDKVEVTYQLITNPDASNIINTAGNNPTPTNWYPTVWSVPDYDDSTTLNIDEMKERIGVRNDILRPNEKLLFTVYPKVLVQTYLTALSAGYAPKRMFVDMTQQTLPHYGLKTTFDLAGITPVTVGGIAVSPFKVKQDFKYFFTCKNVR